MSPRRRPSRLVVAALLVALAPGLAEPQAAETAAHAEDVYLAGQTVDVTRDVRGDLVAAGGSVRVGAAVGEIAIVADGTVTIDAAVGGDVLAAGGEIVLRGECADDARLAGGNVRVAGRVGDDATIAGGTVRIERDGAVGGRAWLAGGEIVVTGTVGRELRASGGRVAIEGTVHGGVQVWADSLEVGPGARIDGDVVHHGPREPRIDPGARIAGRVEHQPVREAPDARTFAAIAWLLLLPALFVTGVAMILLFPRFTPAAARTIGSEPWRSLGVGALALLAAPLAVLALLVTGVGIPLGLVLLAGYPVALLAGFLVAALYLGIAGARRLRGDGPRAPSKGALVLRLLLGIAVLGIVRLVPVLGGLASFAALLFGLGALALELHRAWRSAPARPPPPPSS